MKNKVIWPFIATFLYVIGAWCASPQKDLLATQGKAVRCQLKWRQSNEIILDQSLNVVPPQVWSETTFSIDESVILPTSSEASGGLYTHKWVYLRLEENQLVFMVQRGFSLSEYQKERRRPGRIGIGGTITIYEETRAMAPDGSLGSPIVFDFADRPSDGQRVVCNTVRI